MQSPNICCLPHSQPHHPLHRPSLSIPNTPRSLSHWIWDRRFCQSPGSTPYRSPQPSPASSLPSLSVTPSVRRRREVDEVENRLPSMGSEADASMDGSEQFFPLTPRSDPRRLLRDHHPFRTKSVALMSSSTTSVSASNQANKLERSENQVLEGFLKNNGGYLDDSDSSDDEEGVEHKMEVRGSLRLLAINSTPAVPRLLPENRRSFTSLAGRPPAKKFIKQYDARRKLIVHCPGSPGLSNPCSSTTVRPEAVKSSCQAMRNLKKHRQPFRSLVLGEDDLLRR